MNDEGRLSNSTASVEKLNSESLRCSRDGVAKHQAWALMALAARITHASEVSAAAHIPALVGRGLGMTVRADQPDLSERVMIRIAIPVIQFKRRRLIHPLGDAADFAAMPARVE